MKHSADYYAIVTIKSNRRLYWNRPQQRWVDWRDCTRFTAEERKAYKLPTKTSYWVSVLHGMGADSYYVTETELRSAT